MRRALSLCATERVRFRGKRTLLDQVELLHHALPQLELADLDTAVEFCGAELAAPLWVSAITGGTDAARRLNREMAAVAAELGLGFCLGSMRPLLDDPARRPDFDVRSEAPGALLLGNIGGTEIARRGPRPILDAVADLGLDGLTVHLNPAMELIQPGGDQGFAGVIEAIGALVAEAHTLPVVVKETGCGLSRPDGKLLWDAGVRRVETGGAGGTSWVGVETLRAEGAQRRLGEQLWDWGVPTAVSVSWMVDQGMEVVAGGGIRDGLDVARALALGARLAGLAAPLVRAHAKGGVAAVRARLEEVIQGLRYAMLLTAARTCADLARSPRVLGSDLLRWLTPVEPRG